MGADEERLWVLRAQRGDQASFAKLVEAYQVPVYNLAYRMLGRATEAEDAAQETFLRAYKRLDTCDPQLKFSSWILSIASHYCVDRLRRRRGQTLSMEEIESWRWVPDERPRPEEQTLGRERAQVIRLLLDRLPVPYRLVIILLYWYDLSYEEIAEVTESTQSAVKSRLHRARRAMASMIADSPEVEAAAEHEGRRASENVLSRIF